MPVGVSGTRRVDDVGVDDAAVAIATAPGVASTDSPDVATTVSPCKEDETEAEFADRFDPNSFD
jgi:hypothetical protein